eukprot:1195622-Pyramimonas_sp.AAC.1
MGDPYAVESFGRAYAAPVDVWSEHLLSAVDYESLLAAECPVTHQQLDLSLTMYAEVVRALLCATRGWQNSAA